MYGENPKDVVEVECWRCDGMGTFRTEHGVDECNRCKGEGYIPKPSDELTVDRDRNEKFFVRKG